MKRSSRGAHFKFKCQKSKFYLHARKSEVHVFGKSCNRGLVKEMNHSKIHSIISKHCNTDNITSLGEGAREVLEVLAQLPPLTLQDKEGTKVLERHSKMACNIKLKEKWNFHPVTNHQQPNYLFTWKKQHNHHHHLFIYPHKSLFSKKITDQNSQMQGNW